MRLDSLTTPQTGGATKAQDVAKDTGLWVVCIFGKKEDKHHGIIGK